MIDYVNISILHSAALCGIRITDNTNKAEVAVNCGFCSDKKRHMNLNTMKNVFYCHKCGEYGNSVTLYAKLVGCTNRQAYDELTNTGISDNHTVTLEREPAPLEHRHTVYTAMLGLLSLSGQHRENLIRRGLSLQAIEQNGYRSMPNKAEAERVTRILSDRYDLTGVPGFYIDSSCGQWSMVLSDGILIPARIECGQIQGLQIRLHNEKNGKYCWFSSRYKPHGTKAYSWVHIANWSESKTVFVTEGGLKADTAACLSNDCYIGVAGVQSIGSITHILQRLKIKHIFETYDNDKYTNRAVSSATDRLYQTLEAADISCTPYQWDRSFHSIDHWLQFCRYLDSAA